MGINIPVGSGRVLIKPGGGGIPVPTTVTDLEDQNTSALLHMDGDDGSTTFLDSSANRIVLSRQGSVMIAKAIPVSKFGTAAGYFNGGLDYVKVPNSSDFEFGTGDFTIECWVKPSTGYGTGGFSDYAGSLFDSTGESYGTPGAGLLGIITTGGNVLLWSSTQTGNPGAGEVVRSSSSLTVGSWNHVAFVRQSGNFSIYINGIQDGTASLGANYNFSSSMIIASDRYRLSSGDLKMKGYVDEFRVSTVARYSGATYTVPTSAFTSDANTLLLLHMDGSQDSTNFIDSSGYSRTITVSGNAFLKQTTNPSKFSECAKFTGTDALYTSANSVFAFGTGDFTMECWIYPTNSNFGSAGYSDFGACILDARSNSPWAGVLLATTTSGNLRLWSGGSTVFDSTTTISLNSWSHIALVRSSGTCTIYINGTAAGSSAFTTNCTDSNFTIGSPVDHINGDSFLKHIGYIDEVRISKGIARYTGNFTPSSSPFKIYDPTKMPSSPSVGQVVYADAGKTIAYICMDTSGPVWTRFIT